MSITHNLDILTDKQKSDLELAETLLKNLNGIRPLPNFIETTLKYDGKKFEAKRFGYLHKFLVNDIHLAIKGSFQKHKEFVLDTFQKEVDDYQSPYNKTKNFKKLKNKTSRLLKYYGFNSDFDYPIYTDKPNFKKILENVNNSINSLSK